MNISILTAGVTHNVQEKWSVTMKPLAAVVIIPTATHFLYQVRQNSAATRSKFIIRQHNNAVTVKM